MNLRAESTRLVIKFKWMPTDLTNDYSVLVELGAIRQQAITCADVEPDLCRDMVSLGHNELMMHWIKVREYKIKKKESCL